MAVFERYGQDGVHDLWQYIDEFTKLLDLVRVYPGTWNMKAARELTNIGPRPGFEPHKRNLFRIEYEEHDASLFKLPSRTRADDVAGYTQRWVSKLFYMIRPLGESLTILIMQFCRHSFDDYKALRNLIDRGAVEGVRTYMQRRQCQECIGFWMATGEPSWGCQGCQGRGWLYL